MKRRLAFVFFLAVAAAASVGGCGSSAPSETTSPAFAAVQAIFDAHCVSCHSPGLSATPAGLGYPALPLTAGHSYAALVGQPAHEACGGMLVAPGNPAGSYLHGKLTEATPCEGDRMPAGEAILPQPLPQPDLDTITSWIAAGAED
jgi:hypothetical protein